MYQNAHMAFAIGNDYCSADLHGARWACHAVYAAEQAFVSQTAKRGSSRHRAPYSGKYHDCHRADPHHLAQSMDCVAGEHSMSLIEAHLIWRVVVEHKFPGFDP